MDRDTLIAKKRELESELEELDKKVHWTEKEEKRIKEIKKMKLRIKDLMKDAK